MLHRRICKCCGQEFSTYNEKSYFCSSYCYRIYTFGENRVKSNRKRKLVEVICAECGKVEWVLPSRAKRYKCCSVECLSKYNSKRYSKKVLLTCPICGKEYECKQSAINRHKTCGDPNCSKEWLKQTRKGKGNSRFIKEEDLLKNTAVNIADSCKRSRSEYQHIVKLKLGLDSVQNIPKGYVIHHKDANHFNNEPTNLVVLPKSAHRLIHTRFGNILLRGLHTGVIDRETFIKMCTDDEWNFYKNIIDLDVTKQIIIDENNVNESLESDNIYKNIILCK